MFAYVNDNKLFYQTNGTGTPVFLVMGFGMSSNAWDPQVRDLEKHHQVLRLDNRGVARSGSVTTSYQLSDMAQDVIHILDLEGIEKAHIVGVSMGGMISQHLALTYPDRVRSLTLIATHPGGSPHFLPGAPAVGLFLRANTATGKARINALTKLLYPPKAREYFTKHPDRSNITKELHNPIRKKTLLMQLGACAAHDTRNQLHHLASTPTLVIKPDEDILVRPRGSDYLHDNIPGSKLISFPNAGHGVTEQCAEELNARLLEHFAKVDQRP